jgi:hypothetical protein
MTYVDQVVKFIESNTGGVSLGSGSSGAAGYVDPFTGRNTMHRIQEESVERLHPIPQVVRGINLQEMAQAEERHSLIRSLGVVPTVLARARLPTDQLEQILSQVCIKALIGFV